MKINYIIFFFIIILPYSINSMASNKVFIIHGYGSLSFSMQYVHKSLTANGIKSELFSYHSMIDDLDSVAKDLFLKIYSEKNDTVSFVTHSMGALVVRAMYNLIDSTLQFPYIYRFVMMAPPNKGTPVADFINSYKFIKPLFGPNVAYMTTDSNSIANKLPIPTCEVGLILGLRGNRKGYNPFLIDDNDGLISVENATLGIEKDITFVKSTHYVAQMERKSKQLIINFIKFGNFKGQ